MSTELLTLAATVIVVVSGAVGWVIKSLFDLRRSKKADLSQRHEKLRRVTSELVVLHQSLESLTDQLHALEDSLPDIANFIPGGFAAVGRIEFKVIQDWEERFLNEVAAFKSIDAILYADLQQTNQSIQMFFTRTLNPYLSDGQNEFSEKPLGVLVDITEFKARLVEEIVKLGKSFQKAERKRIHVKVGIKAKHEKPVKGAEFVLVANIINAYIGKKLEVTILPSDIEFFKKHLENKALKAIMARFVSMGISYPKLLRRISFGNPLAWLSKVAEMDEDAAFDYLGIPKEKSSEIASFAAAFEFSQAEEATLVNNREFYDAVLQVIARFGGNTPYILKKFMVALNKGWITPNQILKYYRDGITPALPIPLLISLDLSPKGYSTQFGQSPNYQTMLILRDQLFGYEDRIFYHPLTEAEIRETEERQEFLFPPYFRDFLSIFGLKQDILQWMVWGEGSFSIPQTFLQEDDRGKYILIGRYTEHGVFFIRYSDPTDESIFRLEIIDDRPQLVRVGAFIDILTGAIFEAIADYPNRRLNSEKMRTVSIELQADSDDELINLILDRLEGNEVPEFAFQELKYDVATWKATLQIGGKSLEIHREDSFDKGYPKYTVFVTEPLTDIKSGSLLQLLHDCWWEKGIGMLTLEGDFRGKAEMVVN